MEKSELAQSCKSSSLNVKASPSAGRALLFRNVDGKMATHASCELHEESKWIIQMEHNAIKFIDIPRLSERPFRRTSSVKVLDHIAVVPVGWDDDDHCTVPTISKEEHVLEFYSPHLKGHDAKPMISNSLRNTVNTMDRVGGMKKCQSVLTLIDPLEDVTRKELKRSNLLQPVPISPKRTHQPKARCPQCNSSHVVHIPVCKYCKKLDVLNEPNTAVKRYGYELLQRKPDMTSIQVLDHIVAYLHEHSDSNPMVNKRPESTAPDTPVTPVSPRISPGEVQNLVQNTRDYHWMPSTKEALLEVKHIRSKKRQDKTVSPLTQKTRLTLVHYILYIFSQPHGESDNWTKEQRWDHQDICLEMLKSISMDDVSDIIRAYNAWKRVNDITVDHAAEWHGWREPKPAIPPTIQPEAASNADQVIPDVRTFQLQRRKAIKPNISPEKMRQLVARRSIHLPTSPWVDSTTTNNLHTQERFVCHDDEEEHNKRVQLNAERYKTLSSDGMFYVENSVLFMKCLAPRDFTIVLQYDRQAQEMFLLGDEADRESLLHLSALSRADAVSEWIARNIDNRNLLIAATSAKGQLLCSDERRLLLAMEDEDRRYHLQMWKHWQQKSHDNPPPNQSFLQLHGTAKTRQKRRQLQEYFHVPRFWLKFIKHRDEQIQPIPLTLMHPLIFNIYQAARQQHIETYDLVDFVVEHITLVYGSQAKKRLQGFIAALEQYYVKDTWIFTFCRFCGIADPLPFECFTFYLSAIECLQFALPNRAQQADYTIPNDLFYPLFLKKAIMALQVIVIDTYINDTKWFTSLRDRRIECPRKKNHGKPIYVIGLSTYMDLVLEIWLTNRRSMENEMKKLFLHFDTDKNQNLSYDEFKIFIQQCQNEIENNSHQNSIYRKPIDEKCIIKLYGRCLMHSDTNEVTLDSFVLGGMENPLILALCGFPVPPTSTSAVNTMALQLILRAVRAYMKRKRRNKETI